MYAAVVELNALANAVRTATENHDLLLLGLRDFISVDDVPIMLALMKVARLHGDGTKNIDNYVDVCGYMSLGGEISQL